MNTNSIKTPPTPKEADKYFVTAKLLEKRLNDRAQYG